MSEKKETYGRTFLGFRIIRDTDTSFRKLVARQCYNLTHELVRNKLWEARHEDRFSGNTDAAWMELDRAVKDFAGKY